MKKPQRYLTIRQGQREVSLRWSEHVEAYLGAGPDGRRMIEMVFSRSNVLIYGTQQALDTFWPSIVDQSAALLVEGENDIESITVVLDGKGHSVFGKYYNPMQPSPEEIREIEKLIGRRLAPLPPHKKPTMH